MMPAGKAFIIGFILLGVFSCAKRPALVPGDVLPPVSPGSVTVDMLKDSIAFKGMRSLKSEVSVRVTREGEGLGSYMGIFAYRAPGLMRLRLLSPLGITAMDVMVNDGMAQLYVPREKTIYEGRLPSLGPPRNALFGMEFERDAYVLYAFKPGMEAMEIAGKYSFDPSTLQNTGVSLYSGGSRFIGAVLGEYEGNLPRYMRLSLDNDFVMEIAFKNPEAGAEVPEKYFSPIEAGDKRVLPLSRLLEGQKFEIGR